MQTILPKEENDRRQRIRNALILRMPPLTEEDQRWLYMHAFGDTIEPRRVCECTSGGHHSADKDCLRCEGLGISGSLLEGHRGES